MLGRRVKLSGCRQARGEPAVAQPASHVGDRPPDRGLLSDQHDPFPSPRDGRVEEIPLEHAVMLPDDGHENDAFVLGSLRLVDSAGVGEGELVAGQRHAGVISNVVEEELEQAPEAVGEGFSPRFELLSWSSLSKAKRAEFSFQSTKPWR